MTFGMKKGDTCTYRLESFCGSPYYAAVDESKVFDKNVRVSSMEWDPLEVDKFTPKMDQQDDTIECRKKNIPHEEFLPRSTNFWHAYYYKDALYGQNRPARKMKNGYMTEIKKLSKSCFGDDGNNWEWFQGSEAPNWCSQIETQMGKMAHYNDIGELAENHVDEFKD